VCRLLDEARVRDFRKRDDLGVRRGEDLLEVLAVSSTKGCDVRATLAEIPELVVRAAESSNCVLGSSSVIGGDLDNNNLRHNDVDSPGCRLVDEQTAGHGLERLSLVGQRGGIEYHPRA
jgi:hypothetical protein